MVAADPCRRRPSFLQRANELISGWLARPFSPRTHRPKQSFSSTFSLSSTFSFTSAASNASCTSTSTTSKSSLASASSLPRATLLCLSPAHPSGFDATHPGLAELPAVAAAARQARWARAAPWIARLVADLRVEGWRRVPPAHALLAYAPALVDIVSPEDAHGRVMRLCLPECIVDLDRVDADGRAHGARHPQLPSAPGSGSTRSHHRHPACAHPALHALVWLVELVLPGHTLSCAAGPSAAPPPADPGWMLAHKAALVRVLGADTRFWALLAASEARCARAQGRPPRCARALSREAARAGPAPAKSSARAASSSALAGDGAKRRLLPEVRGG